MSPSCVLKAQKRYPVPATFGYDADAHKKIKLRLGGLVGQADVLSSKLRSSR